MQLPSIFPRLGFHYFPDTTHFRQSDLDRWLPELRSLGASWLTLLAPETHAIPEAFLRGLQAAQIQPVLHFMMQITTPPASDSVRLLFSAYARWGVRYVALFDRPNRKSSWPPSGWPQNQLVERFLDSFLPLAETAVQCGLCPVFPPLEPGGDYWDTAFLRSALRGLKRRASRNLLDEVALSADAWVGNRPLDWGIGGPERWPGVRPYITPPGEQDQCGFRIFDWYLALAEAELGDRKPIFLLRAGAHPEDDRVPAGTGIDPQEHAHTHLAIAHLLGSEESPQSLPSEVLACNFWLLAADRPHPAAWFRPDGSQLPAVKALQSLAAQNTCRTADAPRIAHYLLLPAFEWGVADWHLDAIRPFVKKYRPTVGFSATEAAQAERVTVIGQAMNEAMLLQLRAAGRTVEVVPDGTELASSFAKL